MEETQEELIRLFCQPQMGRGCNGPFPQKDLIFVILPNPAVITSPGKIE
jgi:hypothetical protein